MISNSFEWLFAIVPERNEGARAKGEDFCQVSSADRTKAVNVHSRMRLKCGKRFAVRRWSPLAAHSIENGHALSRMPNREEKISFAGGDKPSSTRPVPVRYGMAAGFVLVALGISHALVPLLGYRAPLILFVAASLSAAWYGGLGPGLVALIAGFLLGDFFFNTPLYHFGAHSPADLILLFVYAGVTAIGLAAIASLHQTHAREQQIRALAGRLEQEVEERARAEEALRQSEERYRALADATFDPVVIHEHGIALDVNHSICGMFGYEPGELLGKNVIDLLVEPESREIIIGHMQTGSEEPYEAKVRKKDGSTLLVELRGRNLDYKGRPVRVISAHDITERKRVEEALRQSENRYKEETRELEALYKSAPWGLILVDRNLRYVRINDVLAETVGLPASQIIGRTIREMVPVLADQTEPNYRRVIDTGESLLNFEVHGRTREQPQRERDWLVSYYPLKDANGLVTSVNSIVVDITERKQAEAALRQSEERFRTAFAGAAVGMTLMDSDGRFREVNPSFCCIMGFTREELLRKDFRSVIYPPDLDRTVELIGQLLAGQVSNFVIEKRFVTKGGGIVWAQSSVSLLADSGGQGTTVLAITEDITRRKQAEESLRLTREQLAHHAETLERRVAERTASLEETIRSLEGVLYHIAHDLRAPLRTLAGFTQLLVEAVGPQLDESTKASAERIIAAAKRMDQLILDLLAYGRLGHLRPSFRRVALVEQIEGVLLQMTAEVKARNAKVQLVEPMPAVRADPALLSQALTQLVRNAVTFVAPGVVPQVRLWAERLEGMVRLWVQDNGIGIEPEHWERIFRVFERLHRANEYTGTGIGLAIVRKGMERMGGSVGVESRPGEGSRFWLELQGEADQA
jgi:PAS domain S-box-containing protein